MTDVLKTLAEFAFNGVLFPVSSSDSEGGEDIVAHQAQGKRGADLEKTGQKPFRGTFRIACFNGMIPPWGNVFNDRYTDIMDAFANHPISDMQHPLHGSFTAGITDYKIALDPMQRNGVYIDVQWIEHNGTTTVLAPQADNDVAGAASSVDSAMAAVQAAITA